MSAPTWNILDSGSFASLSVRLPAGTSINCESDAVITMSDGVDVMGVMSGGLLSSLARAFLSNESFFTTQVRNTNREVQGDALLAPSEPGGILLHQLVGMGDDLLLVKGAYVASDCGVKITSEVQTRIRNSIMSGTGFFLLRARGRGKLACAAYGAVHKYTLRAGETRAVDNGHIVAWTADMPYRTGMASGGGFGGLGRSVTSGEGLMCFFTGPGTVFLQSHKPLEEKREKRSQGSAFGFIIFIAFFMFFAIAVVAIVFINNFNGERQESRGGRSREYGNYNIGMDREF
mmetsp:Transcript_31212/g.61781  ORF Transcript_31212/g.61781 Transcript_31212/m.61781 type:complete len:289 (-) Transcript_31212:195-1061(-)